MNSMDIQEGKISEIYVITYRWEMEIKETNKRTIKWKGKKKKDIPSGGTEKYQRTHIVECDRQFRKDPNPHPSECDRVIYLTNLFQSTFSQRAGPHRYR